MRATEVGAEGTPRIWKALCSELVPVRANPIQKIFDRSTLSSLAESIGEKHRRFLRRGNLRLVPQRLIIMKPNTFRRFVATALAISLVVAACGDSENISSGGQGNDQDTTPPTTNLPDPSDAPDPTEEPPTAPDEPITDMTDDEHMFLDMSEDDAGALAELQGRPWRVARINDEYFALTEDYRVGRVTFEIDNGLVTAATIEGPLEGDAGPPTTVIGPTSNELISGAIVRMITEDNSFGGGIPFDIAYIATLVTADFGDINPVALDQVTAALAGRLEIEFIADAEGKITDLFGAEGQSALSVAVVSVDDIRIDDGTAEIDMGFWCGSLCGIWLTYAAELIDGAWMITGTTGPIAVS